MLSFGQNDGLVASSEFSNYDVPKGIDTDDAIYTIGEQSLGYPMESKIIPRGYVTTKDKYPILQYYVKIKKDFIGKKLINETTKDTLVIKDLKFVETDLGCGTLVFETNKSQIDFSSYNGYILVENKEMIYLAMVDDKEKRFYKILLK
jgi:hypothetical protein